MYFYAIGLYFFKSKKKIINAVKAIISTYFNVFFQGIMKQALKIRFDRKWFIDVYLKTVPTGVKGTVHDRF